MQRQYIDELCNNQVGKNTFHRKIVVFNKYFKFLIYKHKVGFKRNTLVFRYNVQLNIK